MAKTFPIEVVLSSIDGILLCKIGEVYECLNYLFNDANLFTHQLPKAGRQARPFVLRQQPELDNINLEGITPENWQQKVKDIHKYFGTTVDLEQIGEYNGELFADLNEMINP